MLTRPISMIATNHHKITMTQEQALKICCNQPGLACFESCTVFKAALKQAAIDQSCELLRSAIAVLETTHPAYTFVQNAIAHVAEQQSLI
jgi:hypothetical protein